MQRLSNMTFVHLFCCCALDVISNNPIPRSKSRKFSPLFSLRISMDSGLLLKSLGFPDGGVVKNLPVFSGDPRDPSSIPGLGRAPRAGNGNPLQYSCLKNYMDRGVWWATVSVGHKESDIAERTHTFKSLIHLNSISMSGVNRVQFHLSAVVIQFSQHHFFKRLSSSHCMFMAPLSNSSWAHMWQFISGLSILIHGSICLFMPLSYSFN